MTIDQAVFQTLQKEAKGKTVLDLGGYNGSSCYDALQAGASSAVCVDDESWKTYDNWANFTPFEGVTYIKDNFMHYKEPADIVILKNVIYHQRNPWKTLEHVRTLTKEKLILTTSYVEGIEPMWRVYRPYEGHPKSFTVAWRPTLNGLVALLEANGFKNINILVENDYLHVALTAEIGDPPIGFGERN